MKKLPSDLLVILVWIVTTIIFVVTPALTDSLIRSILGVPFILIIPGYVLISALFPKKDELGNIDRIALSFGSSIAVVSLLGLFLNFTKSGIRLESILIGLTIYTMLLIIFGAHRRFEITENERFSIPFRNICLCIINGSKPMGRIDKILSILLIISIIFAIGMLIYIIKVPKTGEKFTEFYILNSSTEKADNYGINLKIDRPVKYLIGITNHEYSDINYTVEAEIGEEILFSKNLTIENEEEWEDNFTLIPKKIGNDMKLKFLLFKENDFTSPYRELYLWINVS